MKPKIQGTNFGSIMINGKTYEHDVLIRLDGRVKKRKKKLSKKVFGTSHILSRAEAEYVYEPGAKRLIFGAGQSGMATISDDAMDYFDQRKCEVDVMPTPEALHTWNQSSGKVIGLFHVTC